MSIHFFDAKDRKLAVSCTSLDEAMALMKALPHAEYAMDGAVCVLRRPHSKRANKERLRQTSLVDRAKEGA